MYDFDFDVYVGDEKLPKYTASDDSSYVEANLHLPCSYVIRDQDDEGSWQNYPVTPFTVRGHFLNTHEHPCYLRLSLDGQQVWMKPFPPRATESFWVRGHKQNNEVHEMLFSLPKITDKKNSEMPTWKKELLGTITLECLEAVYDGTFNTYVKKCNQFNVPGGLMSDPSLKQASKKDCGNEQGGIGVTSRQGRNIASFTQGNQQKRMIRYQLGSQHFGTLTIKYRPRHVLRELGIEDPNWAVEEKKREKENKDKYNEEVSQEKSLNSKSGDSGKNNGECEMEVQNSHHGNRNGGSDTESKENIQMKVDSDECINGIENLMKEKPRKMYCFSPTLKVEKMNVHSPSDTKHTQKSLQFEFKIKNEKMDQNENQQYRVIEVDDDLCILEEIDEDVVYMGDQSCCFMDITPPEIPLVDLVDD